MEIEIKIGREVEGSGVLKVPSMYKKVSRRHATLHWNDGVMTIEDNESANGTFVNGRRVAKTKVKEDDTVWLGGIDEEECYQLDLQKIDTSCKELEKKTRTDFTKEFEDLKQAYIDYQNSVANLKKKSTVKSQLPLRIVSFIPTVLGLVCLLVFDDPTTKMICISIGGVITGLINMLMIGKNSSTADKLSEDMTDLQIKYQKLYRCPKCGKEYSLSTHWKKLEALGKCPHGCGAEFVK